MITSTQKIKLKTRNVECFVNLSFAFFLVTLNYFFFLVKLRRYSRRLVA